MATPDGQKIQSEGVTETRRRRRRKESHREKNTMKLQL